MNLDIILAIVFFIILYGIYFIFKDRFATQGIFVMYRTKLGLKLMDRISKKDENKKLRIMSIIAGLIGIILSIIGIIISNPYLGFIGGIIFLVCLIIALPLNYLSYAGIFLGYAGMIFIFYFLVKGVVDLVLLPSAPPVVSPVLPGVEVAPGIPILSFWHWIIGILVIATIHEFSHGIYARLHKIKIKSSGFAFLGPLLAAFVEPNENQMKKKSKKSQLSVLMAGPFSNVLSGFVFLGIFLIIGAAMGGALQQQGLIVGQINQDLPVNQSGLEIGDVITVINGIDVMNTSALQETIAKINPGEIIVLENANESWNVQTVNNPENESKALIGVGFSPYYGELSGGMAVSNWFLELFFWLWVISFGVGLFNLLPLGPVDGGRMFYLGMLAIFKDQKRADRIFKAVSFISLLLIVINLLPWVIKLFAWIGGM